MPQTGIYHLWTMLEYSAASKVVNAAKREVNEARQDEQRAVKEGEMEVKIAAARARKVTSTCIRRWRLG